MENQQHEEIEEEEEEEEKNEEELLQDQIEEVDFSSLLKARSKLSYNNKKDKQNKKSIEQIEHAKISKVICEYGNIDSLI